MCLPYGNIRGFYFRYSFLKIRLYGGKSTVDVENLLLSSCSSYLHLLFSTLYISFDFLGGLILHNYSSWVCKERFSASSLKGFTDSEEAWWQPSTQYLLDPRADRSFLLQDINIWRGFQTRVWILNYEVKLCPCNKTFLLPHLLQLPKPNLRDLGGWEQQ